MTYSIRPENHELETARTTVESALEGCRYVLEREEDLEIDLGCFDGEHHGARGTVQNRRELQIFFDPETDEWKEHLKQTAASLYGEAWFREKTGEITFVWQQLLASATGLLLLEQIGEGREPGNEGLEEEWQQKKSSLDSELLEETENFSWQLKTLLGRELASEEGLESLPETRKSDVIEAGDQLFT